MTNPRTIARLQARIHERAAYCLQFEVADPRASFITVTRVELSPDITSGKIYYSVLGSEGERSKAEHMLARNGRAIGKVPSAHLMAGPQAHWAKLAFERVYLASRKRGALVL